MKISHHIAHCTFHVSQEILEKRVIHKDVFFNGTLHPSTTASKRRRSLAVGLPCPAVFRAYMAFSLRLLLLADFDDDFDDADLD